MRRLASAYKPIHKQGIRAFVGHIVYISVGMASTLHSSLELCRRITMVGHRVTVVSHRDIERHVKPNGYTFIQLSGDREIQELLRDDPMPKWSARNLVGLLHWVVRRRRARRRSIENDEIEALISTLVPDLLLIDIECHFAVIATSRSGVATLLTMFWFNTFRQPGIPPPSTMMMPGRRWHRRLAIHGAWLWIRMASIGCQWRQRIGRRGLGSLLRPIAYGTNRYHELKAVARYRSYNLRFETDRSQWLRPYMYRRLPILCFNAWEMEFPHIKHPSLHYVGPMIGKHRIETRADSKSSTKWKRFKLDHRLSNKSWRPLVYCSLGSFWSTDMGLVRKILQVFARRTEWDLVIGLGGKRRADAFAPVPSNVIILNWAPQLEVLTFADCMITHAGITSINESIHCNVPMVVYSTKHVDQNGCAARVAYHQLGIMGDKDKDTSEQIEHNIARVLSEPVFRRNVSTMHEHFKQYEVANTAVEVVNEILKKPTKSE